MFLCYVAFALPCIPTAAVLRIVIRWQWQGGMVVEVVTLVVFWCCFRIQISLTISIQRNYNIEPSMKWINHLDEMERRWSSIIRLLRATAPHSGAGSVLLFWKDRYRMLGRRLEHLERRARINNGLNNVQENVKKYRKSTWLSLKNQSILQTCAC